MLRFLWALSLVTCGSAWAGFGTGNGGWAYVCYDDKGQPMGRPRMYDLVEGEVRWKLSYQMLRLSRNKEEMAEKLLHRISSYHPAFAQLLEKKLEYIRGHARFWYWPMPTLDNSNRTGFTKDCHPRQLVTWTDTTGQGSDEIFIDIFLFHQLAEMDQVALYFHEAVYKLFREKRPQLNSDSARRFIAVLFSNSSFRNALPLLQDF